MTANIRHSSDSVEHYTPSWLVEKARYVLGGIDLDPASSEYANQLVRATKIFTSEDNGLLQTKWQGRILLNPPGGLIDADGRQVYRKTKLRQGCDKTGACGLPPGHSHVGVTSSAVVWWRALRRQWELGHAVSALFVGFSLEILQSCQAGDDGAHPLDFPYCIPRERIKFDVLKVADHGQLTRVSGTQPTHSNVLVLLPTIYSGIETTADPAMLARFEEAFSDVGIVRRGAYR